MHIEHNQQLEVHNLISFRKLVTPQELNEFGDKMLSYVESQGAKKVSGGISATYAMEAEKLDIAVYIPINREVPSNDEFTFKTKLLLTNCLKVSYRGQPYGMEEALIKINEYIVINKLNANSVAFIKTINEMENSMDIETFAVDIYVSINANVL